MKTINSKIAKSVVGALFVALTFTACSYGSDIDSINNRILFSKAKPPQTDGAEPSVPRSIPIIRRRSLI